MSEILDPALQALDVDPAHAPDLEAIERRLGIDERDPGALGALRAAAERGVDPFGRSALHVAVEAGLWRCCAALASPEACAALDPFEHTPLMSLANCWDASRCEALDKPMAEALEALRALARHTDLEARSASGRTAILLAAARGCPETMMALAELGAAPGAASRAGFGLAHCAALSGSVEALELASALEPAGSFESEPARAAATRTVAATLGSRIGARMRSAWEAHCLESCVGRAEGSGRRSGAL